MFLVDRLILTGAVLLLAGIISSKFSARLGVPVLVVFLGVGMLAGSEGVGGIVFTSYALAHGVGTLALALILFDGGLHTPMHAVRSAWKPALSLATVGVLVSAAVTGAFAAWLLHLSPLGGFLLGSIVGSTDAAAIFAVLRTQAVRPRLASVLEVESGFNDPMAVFLTVGVLEVILGRVPLGPELLGHFVAQMGVGTIVGIGAGRLAAWLANRIELEAAGLYPLLAAACGLLAFGAAASVEGSGFLAVYLAGIVLGNRRTVARNAVLSFHDGMAWLAQIAMFVMLGLVSSPSRLLSAAGPGLAVALALLLLARPVAVVVSLLPFRLPLRELAFLSWAGVRGAVPIILSTYPLLFGLPQGERIFDVVFFAVVVSTLLQGTTLPWVARVLGVSVPPEPKPPLSLEITSLHDVDGDIVRFAVGPDSRAAGRRVRELALPETAVVALVTRGDRMIPARGSTALAPGDHVFVVLRPSARTAVERVFGDAGRAERALPAEVEFPLGGATTAGDLEEFYGIRLDAEPALRLGDLVRERLGPALRPGMRLVAAEATLVVREVVDGVVEQVGLIISPMHPGPTE